ncbi:hypothetical protein C1646_752326 [Rhizophagus diaphanus]|nr:hypothetical protein C1646_752326 [Rhizophagus diaphanus] [Rhizophagus sp. MUCL 43196]
MPTANLLDQLTPELIPFILKNLSIQDLKKCCTINDIWKDEVLREIRKRLIVDCTFIRAKVTVKAFIDPKSYHGSISKALAKKMDLYISREYGSRYPAVIRDLDIGATNAGKKIVPPSYLGIDTANFVVVDKPEYDLILGSVWLMHIGYAVDRHQNPPWYVNKPKEIEEQEREKSQYRCRKNLWKLPLSLHTFYELLFPEFIATDSDGEVILTKFFKLFHIYMKRNIDLSEYYDSEYTETESSSSETDSSDPETGSEDDMPRPIIYGQAFYSDPALNEIFGQIDINNLDFNAECSTDLTSPEL